MTPQVKININERYLFPDHSYSLMIFAEDSGTPVFHVFSDGWDITFDISTGKEIEIVKKAKNKKLYKYIKENAPKWLNGINVNKQTISNAEYTMSIWKQLH